MKQFSVIDELTVVNLHVFAHISMLVYLYTSIVNKLEYLNVDNINTFLENSKTSCCDADQQPNMPQSALKSCR